MINSITLLGRLTADPELRTTQDGKSLVRFSVAVQRNYIDSTGIYPVDFINCVAWQGTADFLARHFRKGQMIALTGMLCQRRYTGKDDVNRTTYEVQANRISFCEGSYTKSPSDEAEPDEPDEPDESLPF